MLSRFAKSFLAIIFALFLIATLAVLHTPVRAYVDPWTGDLFGEGGVEGPAPAPPFASAVPGGVIMAKLGNATAKAELGRATWKLLHTVTLRYPETPTPDQRAALASYLHLTARLYPCGECAAELQELLRQFPPQTASRRSAALWLCFLHNQVNARLGKPEFDCAHLDAAYDCGCGDAPLAGQLKLDGGPADGDTGAGLIKGGR